MRSGIGVAREPIKVMVVDDSAVVRQVTSEILRADGEIEVLGAASDPLFALRHMERRWPDVIILDVEMPRMDGITFLKKLMAERPTPVVICSSLTQQGADITAEALAAGAVEVIAKPTLGIRDFLTDSARTLLRAVKAAAAAGNRRGGLLKQPPLGSAGERGRVVAPKLTADAVLPAGTRPMSVTTEQVVAIGTSTGGTQALEALFSVLPRTIPGCVVVQHMPERFTAAFADRLDGFCAMEIKEAADGDRVTPGRVLIAPGGRHLLLTRSGAQYRVEVRDGPPVSRHRPSVDVLFRSVARSAGRNAVGILMTGMGDDGAAGLLEMRRAGAHTIAQDEATSLVYGMPREAVARGAAVESLSLEAIAHHIHRMGRAVNLT